MKIEQVYELVNTATKEVLGEETILSEDLSNIVDIGKTIFDTDSVDKYVKSLINHIGKVVFTTRAYKGGVPHILMDSWEFGSVLEKISIDMPKATMNESWELKDGEEYSPNVFYKPTVSAKFFNSKVTFEVPISITERQVKQSFSNATQLNSFLSWILVSVENAMTIRLDSLIMRTLNYFVALKVESDNSVINLVDLYNSTFEPDTDLTPETALFNTDFLKFATYTINLYTTRLSRMSTLFNVGGKERFTPKDQLHVVMIDNFASAFETHLQADTYHKELLKLPNFDTVPYWQGSGKDYSFEDCSSIKVKTAKSEVEVKYLVCVMFDRQAVAVANMDRRTTSSYNPKAEFHNYFYKMDAGYFVDIDENGVIFVLDTPTLRYITEE